ncbi:hypothetical protein SUGI_0902390 [Cryptomeria japonica]|nr:hypothetical protein SUGI_0902390 [Cryptomeria japonica]
MSLRSFLVASTTEVRVSLFQPHTADLANSLKRFAWFPFEMKLSSISHGCKEFPGGNEGLTHASVKGSGVEKTRKVVLKASKKGDSAPLKSCIEGKSSVQDRPPNSNKVGRTSMYVDTSVGTEAVIGMDVTKGSPAQLER